MSRRSTPRDTKRSHETSKTIPKSKTGDEEEEEEEEEPASTTDSESNAIQPIQSARQPRGETRLTIVDCSEKQASKSSNASTKLNHINLDTSSSGARKQGERSSDNEENPAIPVGKKRSNHSSTITVSVPSNSQMIRDDDLSYLRSKSYLRAQVTSPLSVVRRSEIPSSSTDRAKLNRRSDPTTMRGTIRTGVSNRFYAPDGPFQALAFVEHGQLPHADRVSSASVEVEHSAGEDDAVDEEERENEQDPLLLNRPPVDEAPALISPPVIDNAEKKRIMARRKRARTRWHFVYTILHNYHLLDLRKGIISRLTALHIQRSQMIAEQQTPVSVDLEPQGRTGALSQPVVEGRLVEITALCVLRLCMG